MKHEKEFHDFLIKEVNINQKRIDTLNHRVQEVSEFLSQKLPGYQKVERQGSYALKTIIKPRNNGEYDADILVYMKADKSKRAQWYLNEVHNCLKQLKNNNSEIRIKTRCVKVNYPGEFHLDVVPCIIRPNGQYCICNGDENKFEPTDGSAYRNWFNSKTVITSGNLKLVVRLLKHLRNHKNNLDIPSILLTTFAGNNVHDNETSDKAKAKFNSLPDTLLVVSRRINAFLQSTSSMPRMRNPALKSERFTNRRWDRDKYQSFKNQFEIYYEKIKDAYHEPNEQESLRKWRDVFGPNFGK